MVVTQSQQQQPQQQQQQQHAFENILNFRDVGETINDLSTTRLLKPNLLYRSARLDEATPTDLKRLTSTYRLATIIDLRSKTEHMQQAQKLAALPSASSAPPATSPPMIPDTTTTLINFNGTAFSLALMRRLPWLSALHLLSLMALGYRTQAISILGTQVMAPRGLVGLAWDSLAYCSAEVLAVFRVLSDPNAYPVLVHCTQGKDRTGLVVLLVLMLCGVGVESIRADYGISEGELAAERDEKLSEIRSIGLTDEFAGCPDGWVESVCEHVNAEYGGIAMYLLRCGVTDDMQASVKRILLK